MPLDKHSTTAESSTSAARRPRSMRHAIRFMPAHSFVLALLTLATSAVVGLPASLALADARVDVEVKDASGRLASGQVTLTAGSVSKSCNTVGGRCSITIAAGTYQARLIPASGATTTQQVSVPASGSIRLVLQIPAPTAAPATPTTGTSKPGTTTQSQGTTPATANLRNLSTGQRMLVQGSVLDPAGRLTNATITLEQNGRAMGTAKCVGGRFAMYDLAAGTYRVVAVGANGVRATANLTVAAAVLRPTLRLAAP